MGIDNDDIAELLGERKLANGITIRRARTGDVAGIEALVFPLAEERILLNKERVMYYEAIQEFRVAVAPDGTIVGCGALHIMWEDLGEIRTLATSSDYRHQGIGGALVETLLDAAEAVGVSRVFCLTFETKFFEHHGFRVLPQPGVDPEVYAQLVRSHDEGVAEFLELARVKQNTLGNTRMILHLVDRNVHTGSIAHVRRIR